MGNQGSCIILSDVLSTCPASRRDMGALMVSDKGLGTAPNCLLFHRPPLGIRRRREHVLVARHGRAP